MKTRLNLVTAVVLFLFLGACAHQVKKAPCDFSRAKLSELFVKEDLTK